MEDGSDVLIFSHSHQDPSSTALYVLELLKVLARVPKLPYTLIENIIENNAF